MLEETRYYQISRLSSSRDQGLLEVSSKVNQYTDRSRTDGVFDLADT